MTDATSITTGTLISAQKVKGTTVYNLAGEKLGSVEDVMIDKVSGRAIYAVMSFGGFLGMGEKYHPLPWATLRYDTQKGGYVINLDKKLLEALAASILQGVALQREILLGRGDAHVADQHGFARVIAKT